MTKLLPYVNEIISFVVMLLLVAALVSGQMNAQAYKLASLEAAADDRAEVSHFRLEDE
jgi:archaellum component FlaG (FlaF/FlaG flagellin family)